MPSPLLKPNLLPITAFPPPNFIKTPVSSNKKWPLTRSRPHYAEKRRSKRGIWSEAMAKSNGCRLPSHRFSCGCSVWSRTIPGQLTPLQRLAESSCSQINPCFPPGSLLPPPRAARLALGNALEDWPELCKELYINLFIPSHAVLH